MVSRPLPINVARQQLSLPRAILAKFGAFLLRHCESASYFLTPHQTYTDTRSHKNRIIVSFTHFIILICIAIIKNNYTCVTSNIHFIVNNHQLETLLQQLLSHTLAMLVLQTYYNSGNILWKSPACNVSAVWVSVEKVTGQEPGNEFLCIAITQ